MSFTPSIGDVIFAIQTLIEIYNKVHEAPSEIEAAIQDVKGMKAELESMRDKVGDEKYFIKKNGEAMLATITDTFEPLKEDLRAMKQLIRKFSKIPPWSGQKIVFAVFKIPDVKRLQESFNNYRAVYSRAFEHAGAVADAHTAEELKAINRRLEAKNKQLALDFAQLKKQQARAAEMQKDNNAKMDKVLSLIECLAVNPTHNSLDKSFSKVELEDQLVATGLERVDAQKVMGPLIWETQDKQHSTTQSTVTNNSANKKDSKTHGQIRRNLSQNSIQKPDMLKAPGKAPGRARSVSQSRNDSKKEPFSPELIPAQTKPHSPVQSSLKSPSPAPAIKKKTPSILKEQDTSDTSHIWILCVDRTNGFHSILAQTYLELLRLWTANTTPPSPKSTSPTPHHPRWLFSRVSSAGLNLPSPTLKLVNKIHDDANPSFPLMAPARTPSPAIAALTDDPTYYRSTDYPHEKATLISRMSALQPCGIHAHDFETYHHMLCFDASVAADLTRLKGAVEEDFAQQHQQAQAQKGPQASQGRVVISRIHTLPSSAWFQEAVHTSPLEMAEAVSNVRQSLKHFVTAELAWQRPQRIFDRGPCRTVQMVLPFAYRTALLGKIGQGKENRRKGLVDGVPDMKDVTVRLTWQGGKEREQLVSVTGPKEKLKAAEEWIKALC